MKRYMINQTRILISMSKSLFEATTILRSDLKNIDDITMTDISNLNNKMAEKNSS